MRFVTKLTALIVKWFQSKHEVLCPKYMLRNDNFVEDCDVLWESIKLTSSGELANKENDISIISID